MRRSDPEQYQLAFVTGNPMWVSQQGQDSGLVSDDLVLYDTSHPFEAGAVDDPGAITRAVMIQVPREVLPIRAGRVDRLLARRIPAGAGMGAILVEFIGTLEAHARECGEPELGRLGGVLLDLVAACLAQHAGTYGELPVEARRQAMLERVKAFIEHNLGDPDLTPSAVAARHHISVRSLHALFRGEGESVSAFIRRRRLEQARADLARRDLLTLPVHAIAAHWGFTGPAVFSRAFRDRYGIPPRDFRRLAVSMPGCTDRHTILRAGHSPGWPSRPRLTSRIIRE